MPGFVLLSLKMESGKYNINIHFSIFTKSGKIIKNQTYINDAPFPSE